MRVDTRWAQPDVSGLASIPTDHHHNSEQRLSGQSLSSLTLSPPPVTTSIFFSSQRVEPINMARFHQLTQQYHNKTDHIQSITTDEQQMSISFIQNRSVKRIQHPTNRSLIIVSFQHMLTFCLSILISLPCVFVLTLLLPICWLIRQFTRFICRYHCTVTPCSCSYLSASDLFWLYNRHPSKNQDQTNETNKFNFQTISPIAAAVFFLDGTVNEQSLKKLLINRLITSSIRHGSNNERKSFPRFSQIIISHSSGTMWIDYPQFSIDEHVLEIPHHIQTDHELQSYISTIISTELPRNRPLWQLHYKIRSLTRPNNSILVFFYHPVLSDGISLLRILLKHIIDNRTMRLDIKPRYVGQRNDYLWNYIKSYLFGHKLIFSKLLFDSSREDFFKQIYFNNNNNNISIVDSHLQQQRTVVWSVPFNFTQVNRMKLITRTCMNNLFSTIILSTVKLYMERYGILNPTNINCILPCDLRSNSMNITMGNQISHLCFELPMDIEGNIPILWSFIDSIKQIKERGDYATMYLSIHIIYLLFPLDLANKIIARIYNSASLWLTSVAPASSTSLATVTICNQDVRSLICLSPSIGTASMNFCVTSYGDEIRLAVIVDPTLVPDPHFFTRCFIQQLNVVQDLLAHRRIPGEIHRPIRIQIPKKSTSSISDISDDSTIEEIQAKMIKLQQELLSLKRQFENINKNDPTSQTQRMIITTKLEELRQEFRELLIKLQERQCELSGMIPSDEEDEMDPSDRVRLRSKSVASRVSLRSNDQRQSSIKFYQLEREDSNEFNGNFAHAGPSSSKLSLTTHKLHDRQINTDGMKTLSSDENTQMDTQSQISINYSPSTIPFQTMNTTLAYLDSNKNQKTENEN